MRAGVKNNIKADLLDGKMTQMVIHYKLIKTQNYILCACEHQFDASRDYFHVLTTRLLDSATQESALKRVKRFLIPPSSGLECSLECRW